MFAYIDGPYPYRTVILYAFAFGFGAGLFYECFRILRHAVTILFPVQKRLMRILHLGLVFLEDVLFFVTVSALGVLFLYACNRGQLRVSIVLSMGLGFAAYLLGPGKWIFRLHGVILRAVYTILSFVYRHTLRSLFRLLRALYERSLGRLLARAVAYLHYQYRKLYLRRHKRKFSRFLSKGENGFWKMGEHITIN